MIVRILTIIGIAQLIFTIIFVIYCQINWDGELPDDDDEEDEDDDILWP